MNHFRGMNRDGDSAFRACWLEMEKCALQSIVDKRRMPYQ